MKLVLACIGLLALSAQNSKAPGPKPEDYSFQVKASRVWVDTGLTLERGDRVHIHGGDIDCGGPYPDEKAHLPLPSARGGALLAKLEPENHPQVASPDADFSIVVPSHLYLGVNGWQCSGTIPVSVHVDWHKSADQKQ